MKGMIREEFSRAFLNGRFGMVALLAALSFLYGFNRVITIDAGESLGAVMLWKLMLLRGSYGFFAALMAGLPFADSLLQDTRHHYLNQIFMRCRYKEYLSAKLLATLVSGMAAVAIPALLLLVVCCLAFPMDTNFSVGLSTGVWGPVNPTVIEPGSTLELTAVPFVCLSLVMLALFGALYSLVGLSSSFIVKNTYVVLGIPFLLYSLGYFIIPISARLNWLGSTEAALLPSVGLISPAIQYLLLIVLFTAVLVFAGQKDRLLGN
jgi:hypothetical protein